MRARTRKFRLLEQQVTSQNDKLLNVCLCAAGHCTDNWSDFNYLSLYIVRTNLAIDALLCLNRLSSIHHCWLDTCFLLHALWLITDMIVARFRSLRFGSLIEHLSWFWRDLILLLTLLYLFDRLWIMVSGNYLFLIERLLLNILGGINWALLSFWT